MGQAVQFSGLTEQVRQLELQLRQVLLAIIGVEGGQSVRHSPLNSIVVSEQIWHCTAVVQLRQLLAQDRQVVSLPVV